jgi:transglutaminase-like putative cysteine protease
MGGLSFHIKHTSSYYYDSLVSDSQNIIKMYPIEDAFQQVLRHSISVSGNPYVNPGVDIFGNKFGLFTLNAPHNQMHIVSEMEIMNHSQNMLLEASSLQSWGDMHMMSLDSSFQLFLNQKDFFVMPSVWQVVSGYPVGYMTPLNIVLAFNEYVYQNFNYDASATLVDTPMEQVWHQKAGVCQDFANVLIYMLRSVNIPTRYVSGFICPNQDGLRGDGATHAWVEAYLPNFGWLGVDPTNNCVTGEKYVKVAVGRNYLDVAPLTGQFSGSANQTLEVNVTVSYNSVSSF